MGVKRKGYSTFKKLSLPVSYRMLDESGLYDARNVFDNKGVTETRNGIKRFNTTSLGGKVLSVSNFIHANGNRYLLAKVGDTIYQVAATGAHAALKTGLSSTTKHRAITWARGSSSRHIISVEGDGLYQFDGTNFTQLGQDPPSNPTAATTTGSLSNKTYKVHITYYSSVTGFESNAGISNSVSTVGQGISVTNIPATADNATIDTVKIYLENVTDAGNPLYVDEVALGITNYSIGSNPTSALTTPLANAAPIAGGGKYLTEFNRKLVYAGNSTYQNDVFFSEEDLPDAFNNGAADGRLVVYAQGNGEITGLATGLYNNSVLDPYLVIFKKRSIEIYSEINGEGRIVMISRNIGCVCNETIEVRGGVIYFMSENGWYAISNGSLLSAEDGRPLSLGNGAIDDIFSREGWGFQLNSQQFSNFFSAYYSTSSHYLTFVAEGASDSFTKAYNYEEKIGGFRVYEFKTAMSCACDGEDSEGDQCVFLGDLTGTVYTLSVKNERHDEDETGASETISAYVYLPFAMPGDDACTYNFRTLTIKALRSDEPITIRVFPKYDLSRVTIEDYDFTSSDLSNEEVGFVLDVSLLDEGILTDDRIPVVYSADINRTGETMMIGFYQDAIDANIGIISSQLVYNKNGNRNL